MSRGSVHGRVINLRALVDGVCADFALRTRERGLNFEALAFVAELNADPS